MQILLVKLSSIGDIVHTLPSLAMMRQRMPSARIAWAVDKRFAEILRENPIIDNLIELDLAALRRKKSMSGIINALKSQVRELRRQRFDLAIDFQGLLKSAAVARVSGAKERWGFSGSDLREPAARLFLTDVVAIPPDTHVIHKNLFLAAQALGQKDHDCRWPAELEFPIKTQPHHIAEAEKTVQDAGGKFAILNPAGGWPTKLWDAEKYGKLADLIWEEFGLCPVITSSPGEGHLADRVFAASRTGTAIKATPSLKGFFELAKRAAIYIGGDTGPTHLAVAAGTPVIGIFGPTEWWRNGSINPDDICVERTDIDCRVNCHRRSCSNWICLDIAAEEVLEAARKRLATFDKRARD